MWSDRFNYYNIQSDQRFSQKMAKSVIVECLLEKDLFKQTSTQTFTNTDKFPRVDIILAETYDGSFAVTNKENQFITLIAIVCPKREDIDQRIYIDTFKTIADKLNWKLYLEEDDDGNENIEIKE